MSKRNPIQKSIRDPKSPLKPKIIKDKRKKLLDKLKQKEIQDAQTKT